MHQYEAAWLRRAEVFQLFADHGFQESAAIEWLSRAIVDRGIVWDGTARPEGNLFRLTRVLPALSRRAQAWTPDPEAVAWESLEIAAPDRVRLILTPATIEVSAKLLRRELSKATVPALTRRRGRRPLKRVEIAERMRADIQAERRTETELRGMMEKELESEYGATRKTVVAARDEVLARK